MQVLVSGQEYVGLLKVASHDTYCMSTAIEKRGEPVQRTRVQQSGGGPRLLSLIQWCAVGGSFPSSPTSSHLGWRSTGAIHTHLHSRAEQGATQGRRGGPINGLVGRQPARLLSLAASSFAHLPSLPLCSSPIPPY